MVEHCVSSANGCGFNSQGTHILIKKCIAWMHCKSLWIKASSKCKWWTEVVLICGLLCFYQLFELLFWWHPFTTFTASEVMLNFSKSVPMKKKKLYISDDLTMSRPTFSANVHFGVNCSFQKWHTQWFPYNTFLLTNQMKKTTGKYLKRMCLPSFAPFSQQFKGRGKCHLI